jgi:molybdenum-dependent DNA-binding transcriptional regulator ModE
MGGLNDAIAFAAKKAGISKKKVLYYPLVKEDKLAAVLEMIEGSSEELSMKSTELPKELLRYYEKLKMLESYTGIQMRMPLEVTFN